MCSAAQSFTKVISGKDNQANLSNPIHLTYLLHFVLCRAVLDDVPHPLLQHGEQVCRRFRRCLLNQACRGGEKRWYTSTLELQLASLELCRACRRVPTLHVLVYPRTLRTLWSPCKPHRESEPGTGSSKVRLMATCRSCGRFA